MHIWAEFRKLLPVKNISQVLESPLWYNENIGRGKAFVKKWHEKGIQVLFDTIAENVEFYTFEELKAKYDIKGTFLDYHSLITIFDSHGKHKLMKNNYMEGPGSATIK